MLAASDALLSSGNDAGRDVNAEPGAARSSGPAKALSRRAPLPCRLPRLRQACRILPRLCAPYRAQTKGKVERFIGYLKRSFGCRSSPSMRQAGVTPDKHAANAAVARWLREVANAPDARDDQRVAGRAAADRESEVARAAGMLRRPLKREA